MFVEWSLNQFFCYLFYFYKEWNAYVGFTCIVGSEKNMFRLTLDGVDVMGDRLAEEVQ
jgi:hypothetical protein